MTRYSTFWPRFWAGIVDSLIDAALIVILYFAWPGLDLGLLTAVWMFVAYFAFSAYVIAMHFKFGQTLGKMITKVVVLREKDEGPITLQQAILRESPYLVLLWIGWIAAVGLIGVKDGESQLEGIEGVVDYAYAIWLVLELLTMLFNQKRRALHDYIAGTVVVRLNS